MANLRSTAPPKNGRWIFLTGWNISLLMVVGVQKDRRCFPDLSCLLHYFQVSNFSVYDWGVAINQMGHWPLQNWCFLCLNIAPGKHSNAASNTSEGQSMLDLTATWWDCLKMKGTPFKFVAWSCLTIIFPSKLPSYGHPPRKHPYSLYSSVSLLQRLHCESRCRIRQGYRETLHLNMGNDGQGGQPTGFEGFSHEIRAHQGLD